MTKQVFCMCGMRRRSGQVALIVAVGIAALLGVTALVTDYGMALVAQTRLQTAIDAAVLAGAAHLMDSEAEALAEANRYLQLNGVATNAVVFTIDANAKRISAMATDQQGAFFGRILGINTLQVHARSGAAVGVAGSVTSGLKPFAVTDRYYDYGELITLKTDTSYHGNYGAVALGGSGASTLRDNALYGYNGTIKIGDLIPTEPGNMSSVVSAIKNRLASDCGTFENHNEDSYRLWTIPVVDTLEVNGRKDVTVVGFAQVFVENVIGKSGKMEIVGRFMRFVGSGDIVSGATDYGVYAAKLDQ